MMSAAGAIERRGERGPERIIRGPWAAALEREPSGDSSSEPADPGAWSYLRGLPRLDDEYVVGKLVGSGGMGEVYQVSRISDGLDLVAKQLKIHHPRIARRFSLEAEILALAKGPGIPELHAFGLLEGTPSIVMERLGISLHEAASRKRLSPEVAARYLSEVLPALERVHDLGIIHRDLKPSNLLLSPHEGACICDFGIARMAGSDVTHYGSKVGTPAYSSPEHQEDARSVTPSDDLYSLGLVLGVLTVEDFSDSRRSLRHAQARSIALSCVHPSIRPIVDRATRIERSERYQSAREMLAALRAEFP